LCLEEICNLFQGQSKVTLYVTLKAEQLYKAVQLLNVNSFEILLNCFNFIQRSDCK